MIELNLPDPWDRAKPNVEKNPFGYFTEPKRVTCEKLMDKYQPKVLLELGSWLGQSSLWFAERCETVICVDTWLGSDHFFLEAPLRKTLPIAYETFLVNCWERRDQIFPIRLQSHVALWYLADQGIEVDAVYIDASHHYKDVVRDIEMALKLPGKPLLFGDDYIKEWTNSQTKDVRFPVRKGVEKVFGNNYQHEGPTWWVEV